MRHEGRQNQLELRCNRLFQLFSRRTTFGVASTTVTGLIRQLSEDLGIAP